MSIEFIYPEFEVIRNVNRRIPGGSRVQQCANGVHSYNSETKRMECDESKCVNCHPCVSFLPHSLKALKITKSDCSFRENANWSESTMKEIYKQASRVVFSSSSTGYFLPSPCLLGTAF